MTNINIIKDKIVKGLQKCLEPIKEDILLDSTIDPCEDCPYNTLGSDCVHLLKEDALNFITGNFYVRDTVFNVMSFSETKEEEND